MIELLCTRGIQVGCAALLFLAGRAPARPLPQRAPAPTVMERAGTWTLAVGSSRVHTSPRPIHTPRLLRLPGASILLWSEVRDGASRELYSLALAQHSWCPARVARHEIALRYGSFDPLRMQPTPHPALASLPGERLFLVQYRTQGIEAYRIALRRRGARVFNFVPDAAQIIRIEADKTETLAALPFVRWIGPYHPAFRLEEVLVESIEGGSRPGPARYSIALLEKGERDLLIEKVTALGGVIANRQEGSLYIEAILDRDQLIACAHLDEVLWIDRFSPPQEDVDHARRQLGADALEAAAGYTGIGVRAEIYEGIEFTHPDFAPSPVRSLPLAHGCSAPSRHGQRTFGIIFGSGLGRHAARGICPDAQGLFCNPGCTTISRYRHVGELVDPTLPWRGMHQSASWGGALTRSYTSLSADLDNIIFDHDITITQSQSNSGTRDSRPQAWAKNVISVGGIYHGDNASPGDDHWSGGASIGPASDGRIKPDLCAYYDSILTTDTGGGYTASFGGTSGATPIVAGATLLIHQMWTDGIFGNTLAHPGASRFENRAHFTTIKALLVASARQYPFSGSSHDLTRTHQGWGFPDPARLYASRAAILVVDEEDLLSNLEIASWPVDVPQSQPQLKVVLVYADKEGTLSASKHRINDLDLRVRAPTGALYLGNRGLLTSTASTPGGNPDDRNTVECVFVDNPPPGRWVIEVSATELNADGHLQTPEIDADYALVALGAHPVPPCRGTWRRSGSGCPDLPGGQGTLPRMTISNLPCLGSRIALGTTASPSNQDPQFLVMGLGIASWNGIALPLDLGVHGAQGCRIYCDHTLVMPIANPGGGASIELAIPRDPVLAGERLYWQGFFLSPLANPLGLAVSDLLEVRIDG